VARTGHDRSWRARAHPGPSNVGVSSRLFFAETLTRANPNVNQFKIGFDWCDIKFRLCLLLQRYLRDAFFRGDHSKIDNSTNNDLVAEFPLAMSPQSDRTRDGQRAARSGAATRSACFPTGATS